MIRSLLLAGLLASAPLLAQDGPKAPTSSIADKVLGGTPATAAGPGAAAAPAFATRPADRRAEPSAARSSKSGGRGTVDVPRSLAQMAAALHQQPGPASATTQVRQTAALDRLLGPSKAQLQALAASNQSPRAMKVRFGEGARLRSVRGNFPIAPVDITRPAGVEAAAVGFLKAHDALFNLSAKVSLVPASRCIKALCRVRVQRQFEGLEIWGGDVVVTLVADEVRSVVGNFDMPAQNFPAPPAIAEADMRALVLHHFGRNDASLAEPISYVTGISTHGNRLMLAYKVRVMFGVDEAYDVYVDAVAQKVLYQESLVHSVFENSSGTDLDGIPRNFRSEDVGGTNLMRDDSFPSGAVSEFVSLQNRLDFNNAIYVNAPAPNGPWDPTGVSALSNARSTYNYFLDSHGRNGVEGNGAGLLALVHVGSNYAGAFWSSASNAMFYGDGDNVIASNLAGSLDVAAHEMTHGVISHTSNLQYLYQSGALNESFADIFGAMVDDDDWLLGEDVWLASPGYLRSMSAPASGYDPQPAHMDEYQNLPENYDSGGVHINSGIPNRAFYLLAEGLSTEGLGTSVGRAKAADIAYATMVGLPSNPDFFDAAQEMLVTAEALYGAGSPEATAVIAAWDEVGIDLSAPGTDPTDPTPGDAADINAMAYLSPRGDGFKDVYVQFFGNEFLGYNASLDFQLNSVAALNLRPSGVTLDDDSWVFFYIAFSGDLYMVDLATLTNTPFNQADVQTVVVSPDFTTIVMTLDDDSRIYVYDVDTGTLEPHQVTGPDYSASGSVIVQVDYVDTVRFDPTGRKVVFDYRSCRTTPGNPCSVHFWSIGVLDLDTGAFQYPFPSQPEYVDVGYPAFANLTDRYIVLDIIDYENFDLFDAADSGVFVFDLYARSFAGIANPDLNSYAGLAWGSPSFSADDSGIIFQTTEPSGFFSDANYGWLAALSNYQLSGVPAPFVKVNPFQVYLPFAFPASYIARALPLNASPAALDFGTVGATTEPQELCLVNETPYAINVSNSVVGSAAITTELPHAVIHGGGQLCGKVKVDISQLGGDVLNSQITFINDGDANLVVPVAALLDTDGDGAADNTDTDDDNDGLTDMLEGTLGSNSKKADTDGDGYDDKYEYELGTDLLDDADMPASSNLKMLLWKAGAGAN